MTLEGIKKDGVVSQVPPRRQVPHYHGEEVQMIFFAAALILIVAQSMGAELPLSTFGAVVAAILLVIAAGLINPFRLGIHWANALISICGTLLFGTSAIDHYRSGTSIFDKSFISIEALALLSIVALYFTTRTIRGTLQRPELE